VILDVADEGNGYKRLSTAIKSGFLHFNVVSPYTETKIDVYNNAGTLVGSYAIPWPALYAACGGDISTMGATNDRLYFFGASSSQPYCLIYEHTLTFDGSGLLTGAVVGALLHTLTTPQTNTNINVPWQDTAIDTSLWL
jgi:hypothetical protein